MNFEKKSTFYIANFNFLFSYQAFCHIIINCLIAGVASCIVTSLMKKRAACGKNGVWEISEFSNIITQDRAGY